MIDTPTDQDDLKQVWQALERRLARQEALLLDSRRVRLLDGVRASLRPLRWGQSFQIWFGVVVVLASISSWRAQWHILNVRVAAFVMQAYGVALIAAGARTLTMLERVDYGAPVVEIQRRLAEVGRWYAQTSLASGMAWWLLWVPALMMLGGAAGKDILALGPRVLGGYAAACVVGLVLSLWMVGRAERSSRPAVRAWAKVTAVGRGLVRAEAALDEIIRFEAEPDGRS